MKFPADLKTNDMPLQGKRVTGAQRWEIFVSLEF